MLRLTRAPRFGDIEGDKLPLVAVLPEVDCVGLTQKPPDDRPAMIGSRDLSILKIR